MQSQIADLYSGGLDFLTKVYSARFLKSSDSIHYWSAFRWKKSTATALVSFPLQTVQEKKSVLTARPLSSLSSMETSSKWCLISEWWEKLCVFLCDISIFWGLCWISRQLGGLLNILCRWRHPQRVSSGLLLQFSVACKLSAISAQFIAAKTLKTRW